MISASTRALPDQAMKRWTNRAPTSGLEPLTYSLRVREGTFTAVPDCTPLEPVPSCTSPPAPPSSSCLLHITRDLRMLQEGLKWAMKHLYKSHMKECWKKAAPPRDGWTGLLGRVGLAPDRILLAQPLRR